MNARFSKTTALALAMLGCLGVPLLSSSGPAATTKPFTGKYIGADKCKNCHSSKETGDQYGVWAKAKHSHAYEVLASDAAKESATKAGVSDPAKDGACLQCHVTGYGEPEDAFKKGFKEDLGVQCETCHGANEDHMKARFKAAMSGEKPEGYQGTPEGEVIASPGVDVCVKCHNPGSPNYKPFCYYEARGKIAHLNPQKPRTEEEKANYGVCPHGTPCPHADGCPEGTCNLTPEQLAAMKK